MSKNKITLAYVSAYPWLGILVFFSVYLFLLIAANTTYPMLMGDSDTFWHVATGDWIWGHHQLPSTDPFSAIAHGHDWIVHYWLSSVLFAFAKYAIGWRGCVILCALMFALALALLAKNIMRYLNPSVALCITVLSFILLLTHLTPRPHILVLPWVVIWVAEIERARVESRAPSWLILPILAIWVNLHGIDAIVGVGIALVFAIEAVIYSNTTQDAMIAFKQWGTFVLLALMVSCFSPIGWLVWYLPFHILTINPVNFISEWQTLNISTLTFEVWFVCIMGISLLKGVRVPPFRLLIFLCLTVLTLGHRYLIDFLAILFPFLLATPFRQAFTPDWDPISVKSQLTLKVSLVLIFFFIVISVYTTRNLELNNQVIGAPVAALSKAKQLHLIDAPTFNSDLFGGYMIYAGVKPFIDNRVEVYGDTLYNIYACAITNSDYLQKVLDHYQISWILVSPNTTVVEAIKQFPLWERVYSDNQAAIYRRKELPNTKITMLMNPLIACPHLYE